jgi:TPR repeat protein
MLKDVICFGFRLVGIFALTLGLGGRAWSQQPIFSNAFVTHLTKLAEGNDVEAQYTLGAAYLYGNDLPQNTELGVKWLRSSASKGNIESAKILYVLYSPNDNTGQRAKLGVAGNTAEYIKWLSMAAKAGDVGSQADLGYSYYKGIAVERDKLVAQYWLEKCAESGNVSGQMYLAMLYYDDADAIASAGQKKMIDGRKWLLVARAISLQLKSGIASEPLKRANASYSDSIVLIDTLMRGYDFSMTKQAKSDSDDLARAWLKIYL